MTTLKASFFLLFLNRKFFSVPPGRYSTTTQQALVGWELRPSIDESFEGIFKFEAPIEAPTNCKQQINTNVITRTVYNKQKVFKSYHIGEQRHYYIIYQKKKRYYYIYKRDYICMHEAYPLKVVKYYFRHYRKCKKKCISELSSFIN